MGAAGFCHRTESDLFPFHFQLNLPKSHITVDGLIFVGYQFSWFSWMERSLNSRTNELAIFCMNYERKYYGHEF